MDDKVKATIWILFTDGKNITLDKIVKVELTGSALIIFREGEMRGYPMHAVKEWRFHERKS